MDWDWSETSSCRDWLGWEINEQENTEQQRQKKKNQMQNEEREKANQTNFKLKQGDFQKRGKEVIKNREHNANKEKIKRQTVQTGRKPSLRSDQTLPSTPARVSLGSSLTVSLDSFPLSYCGLCPYSCPDFSFEASYPDGS